MEYIEVFKWMLFAGLTFGSLGVGGIGVYTGAKKTKVIGCGFLISGFVFGFLTLYLYGNDFGFWQVVGMGLGTIVSLGIGVIIAAFVPVWLWSTY